MKNKVAFFTSGEFAKLHRLNKRTLHYYDEIGLFSPSYKGDNGYRYYTFAQSMALENILALRELGMSIEEIKKYTIKPSNQGFVEMATDKIADVDRSIKHLKMLKQVLQQRIESIEVCQNIYHEKIEILQLKEEYLLMTPLEIVFESQESLTKNAAPIMLHLQKSWELCQYKKSFGSFCSIEKVKNGQLDTYDGVFTVVGKKEKGVYVKPCGKYMRGFCVGDWDKIPKVYEKMLEVASQQGLELIGFAFEMGLNEVATATMEDYVTQIEIQCKERS